MEFNSFHRDFFNAINGAFSRVTEREHFDSQITLTDVEEYLVESYFGLKNIHIGKVGLNRDHSEKRFLLYNDLKKSVDFTPIYLNLVFPKQTKPELRLYLSKSAGFKPKGGDIWFIFENTSHELVIGAMEENKWRAIGQYDSQDEEYQDKIEDVLSLQPKIGSISPYGKIQTTTLNSKIIYQRDPLMAIMRIMESGYKCEVNPSHTTFISQKTNLPFMEAHHLIPIKFQPQFEEPLDNFDNIISLCPICHRGVHHAVTSHKFELLNILYENRPALSRYSLDFIAQFYNCIEIPADQ